MALPHDLRDCELRSYVEVPATTSRTQPDNPVAQRVVLVDSNGANVDNADGAVLTEQGAPGPITSPWFFALADPVTRAWAQVAPGGRDPTRGAVVVNTEGLKFTYTGIVNNITPGTTATDFVVLAGSPTKTVRVSRIEISGASAALAQAELLVILRSTAEGGGGTAGTNTTITAHDPQNPTSGAVLTAYTTSPTTLGATVGTIRQTKYQLVSTTAAAGSAPVQLVYDFGLRNEQCPVLRGAASLLCLNQNGAATATSTVYDVAITWTEE